MMLIVDFPAYQNEGSHRIYDHAKFTNLAFQRQTP